MAVAEIIRAYLDVLAWPTVVVVAILLFRSNVGAFIDRVTEARAGGVSVKAEKVAQELANRTIELASGLSRSGETTVRPAATAEQSEPETVGRMLIAWKSLEDVARQRVWALSNAEPVGLSMLALFRELERAGLVSHAVTTVAADTQHLRNRVVHLSGSQITGALADDFIATCKRLQYIVANA